MLQLTLIASLDGLAAVREKRIGPSNQATEKRIRRWRAGGGA
jgi:hypothetical protein